MSTFPNKNFNIFNNERLLRLLKEDKDLNKIEYFEKKYNIELKGYILD